MGTKVNLLGMKFGKLTVISETGKNSHGKITWNCRCECGKYKRNVISGNLVQMRSISCGSCYKTFDLTGQRFGELTVTSFSHREQTSEIRGRLIWNCTDDQGNTRTASTAELRGNRVNKVYLLEDVKEVVARDIMTKYRNSAKTRKYKFELTFQEFKIFIYKNCEYCGSEPKNKIKSGRMDGSWVLYNGVDRKNNKEGYSTDNCVTCCRTCNRAKYFLGMDVWLDYLKGIYTYYPTLLKNVKGLL